MRRFKATSGGITVTFNEVEANVLRDMAEQVAVLLRGHEDRIGDRALERLLPDGYRGNPEDAQEFRRLTQGDLVADKVAGAATIIEALSRPAQQGSVRLMLMPEDAVAWLRSLNDIRLAMAVRLGIENEQYRPDPTDNDYAIYLWLGQVQHSLLRAVDR